MRMPVQSEKQKRRNDAISRASRRSAASRRCPVCERKGALKRIATRDPSLSIRVCRYCGHERAVDSMPKET